MFKLIENFGNPIALLLSIMATVFISFRWKANRPKNSRRFLVGLLYWGPLLIMACMLFHVILNAHRAYVSIRDTGVFNFYFYSLQLFGFILGYQSYRLLRSCLLFVSVGARYRKELLKNIGLILLITLPTLAFTIISIIPPVVLTISFLASLGVHRKPKAQLRSGEVNNAERTPVQPDSILA